MARFSAWGVVFYVAFAASGFTATPPDPEQAPFAKLTGPQLIAELQKEASRSRAFYELWRRTPRTKDDHPDQGFAAFLDSHYDTRVVVCPQGEGQEPIYLVLYGFTTRFHAPEPKEYPAPDPDSLFPPRPLLPEQKNNDSPAIAAFTAEGKEIKPFGGNNVLDQPGVIADLTGDGLLERADETHYGGVQGVHHIDVLHVSTIKDVAQPLLSVLYNWNSSDWTYRIRNGAQGQPEITLGPRTKDGIKAKVIFRWDSAKRMFVGPEAREGDHYRVLDDGDMWKQFNALHAANLTFPADPDFEEEKPVVSYPAPGPSPAPPPAQPYQRRSLADLSDADLLRLMGPGRNVLDFERDSIVPTHLPSDFWTSHPREVALALVRENLPKNIPADFQIALDDRHLSGPPELASIAFSTPDEHYFVRIDPKGSYLAFGRRWTGQGISFCSSFLTRLSADLRFCPLSYEDARQLARTIWWLDRVRTRSFAENFEPLLRGYSEGAPGSGQLTLRSTGGKVLLQDTKPLWRQNFSENCNGYYDREAMLNLTAFLMTKALPERLGPVWTQADPNRDLHDPAAVYTAADLRHLNDLTLRFLTLFSVKQDRISFAVAADAASAAGSLHLAEARPLLKNIVDSLPAPSDRLRTGEAIFSDRQKIGDSLAKATSPEDKKSSSEKLAVLEEEEKAIAAATTPGTPRQLRDTAEIALRQLRESDNSAALYAWATSPEQGNAWALQRLSVLDSPRYVQALAWWLNYVYPAEIHLIMREIERVAPDRVEAFKAAIPPEKKSALGPPAAAREADKIPDNQQRVAALLAIALDPKIYFSDRSDAIRLLVPYSEPLRHPQREIDDALLRIVDLPETDGSTGRFTAATASEALARRGRIDAYDHIEKALPSADAFQDYGRMLGALTLLAQTDPPRFTPRLQALLAPQLKETNKRIPEIIWAIWAADLRQFLPDLERLGTATPDDYEDSKANTAGGAVTPVTGRFHSARQIADIWNADDPLTRIRLLVALALANSYSFVSNEPSLERVARLQTELKAAAATLTPDQRTRLDEFFHSLEQPPPNSEGLDPQSRDKILALARQATSAS